MEARTENKARLTEGSVKDTLVRLTIPMIFGILGMSMFHLVDRAFIGMIGIDEQAAMGFAAPVIFVIFGIAMGLGVGASAVVSRAIGKGDHYQVRRLATDSLLLSVLVVALSVCVGMLTIDPIFRLLGAKPEIVVLIKQYMKIWYPGVVFVVAPIIGNQIIRATGDTKTPSIIMLIAVALNALLDPIFIFGLGPFPRMELAGAALATVIGRSITLVIALWILCKREKLIILKIPKLKEVFLSWKRILHVGLPAAGTNIIAPVAIAIIIRLVASYGKEAVAAFGVGAVVSMFAFAVVMALATVLGPFVGQNWGAGRHQRVELGIKYGQRFALAWGVLMFILLAIFAAPFASLFSKDPLAVSMLATYLRIVPLGYGLRGVYILCTSSLNVLHRPFHAAAVTTVHLFVLYIPLSFLGSYLIGLEGIFIAAAISPAIVGIIAYLLLKKVLADIRQAPSEMAKELSPSC